MQNTLPDIHAIDDRRISSIRNQLAEDTYIIDPQQIASKIIALEIAFCKPLTTGMQAVYHA